MTRAWRWVAAVVVVAIGGSAVAGLWLLSSAMPATGRHEVEGLSAPVSLFRDDWGVPHIFAETDEDASFALGWAHAEDRLWQMETMRRLGAGRLAEVLGPAALASDRWMRTLGLYRLAERDYAALSERHPTRLRRLRARRQRLACAPARARFLPSSCCCGSSRSRGRRPTRSSG